MQNRLIFQVSAADSSENPSFPADQHIGARRARNGAVPFGDKGKNRVLSLFQLCKQFPVVHVSSPCVDDFWRLFRHQFDGVTLLIVPPRSTTA